MSILLQILKNYKTAFSRTQLLQLREKHSYFKLYNETSYTEIIDKFIERYGSYSSGHLPEIITLIIPNSLKYIYRDHIFPLFADKIDSLTYKVNKELNDKLLDRKAKPLLETLSNDEASYNNYFEEHFKKRGRFSYRDF